VNVKREIQLAVQYRKVDFSATVQNLTCSVTWRITVTLTLNFWFHRCLAVAVSGQC